MRVGLFFGSFNPLHNGHLAVAGYMLESGNIDRLWFVVSPNNPFKDPSSMPPAEARCSAVQRVLDAIGDTRVQLSRVELSLPTPSYTINTLDALRDRYPAYSFSIIMGGDSLQDILRWKEGTRIVEQYQLLVYPRGDMGQVPASLLTHRNVTIVPAPLFPISSTFIRNGRAEGKNMDFYTPLVRQQPTHDSNVSGAETRSRHEKGV